MEAIGDIQETYNIWSWLLPLISGAIGALIGTYGGSYFLHWKQEKKIKNVEFLGFKAGEELEEIIKGARFTLIPSIWYDNLPNTALESFQYSKPVIASDIGSLPELVLDGVNGYLFKPADARELCEKVALLDNDDVVEKMGAASRARLEDRFAPQTHYNTLMKVFSRVRKEN